eukprot:PhF_6_TR44171/c1_g1_i1/m.67660
MRRRKLLKRRTSCTATVPMVMRNHIPHGPQRVPSNSITSTCDTVTTYRWSSNQSHVPFPAGHVSASSDALAVVSPRCSSRCSASWSSPVGPSPSTAVTSLHYVCTTCGPRSPSSPRTPCCSRAPSGRTSTPSTRTGTRTYGLRCGRSTWRIVFEARRRDCVPLCLSVGRTSVLGNVN